MKFPKPKTLRLRGKKKIDLYIKVWENTNGCCAKCGKPIEFGTIPHHKMRKSQGGEDTMENLEMLCAENCHHVTDGKMGGK